MLLLSGAIDMTAPPETSQKPVFDTANVPVTWATLDGAGHLLAMHDAGPYRGMITAWFLYALKGDQKAGAMFNGPSCFYCTAPGWSLQRKGG